jgi:hypothetical protein
MAWTIQREIAGKDQVTWQALFSREGDVLAVLDDGDVKLRSTQDYAVIKTLLHVAASCIAWSPVDDRLLVGCAIGTYIWRTQACIHAHV